MTRKNKVVITIVLLIVTAVSVFAYFKWQAYEASFNGEIQGPLGHRKHAVRK